jgi:hypothetical protein
VASTRRGKKRPDLLTFFFVDRSIAGDEMPAAIRTLGYDCLGIGEVYGKQKAQYVADPRWLRRCSNEQWIVVTRDYLAPWHRVIDECESRIFRVARSAGSAPEQVRYVENNINKIVARSRKPGPYIYRVDRDDLEKVYPGPLD